MPTLTSVKTSFHAALRVGGSRLRLRFLPGGPLRRAPLALRLGGVLLLLVAAVVGVSAGASFFAVSTSGASRTLQDEMQATSRAGNTIHFLLIEAGNYVQGAREAALKGETNEAAARYEAVVSWAQGCLEGGPECPRPPEEFVSLFREPTAELMILAEATAAAVFAAPEDDKGYEQLRNAFVLAADRVHARVSEWQARRIESIATHMEAMSEAAKRMTAWVLLAAGMAVALGVLGGAVARGALGRLRMITAAMLRLATGDRDAAIPASGDIDEIGDMARALGVFRDTARLLAEREAELRSANVNFDSALNGMVQGLCMFDADSRLVVSNARFLELFRLPPEAAAPGSPYAEVLARMVATGKLDADDASERLERVQRFVDGRPPVQEMHEVYDGRSLSVRFTPTEGGGWMLTYEDITERRLAEAKIAHMAHHDALTGLPNRALFQAEIQAASAGAAPGSPIAVLCLDLDRFKQVNDTLGHPAGDELLRQVAARLQANIRRSDTLARLGGDEFAVIQTGVTQLSDTFLLARRFVKVLSEPFDLGGHQANIGTSVGIAFSTSRETRPDELMTQADLALYAAKADGRGTFRFFEADMTEKVQTRRTMEMDLRRALALDEFEVHYQPVVDLATRHTVGLEALVRWRHPERGMISPAEFIPLAEEIGLIAPIGEWVLQRACAEAAAWPEEVGIAVNVSAFQFKGAGLVPSVISALDASGLSPDRLWLEITETAMVQDTTATLEALNQLRHLGVRTAMDDFGTGYSSLSYLHSFPFDKIKIDQSFTQKLPADAGCHAIVRAIAGLGISLGMTIIVEGIETEEQAKLAAAEGCTQGQGYLFSRPRPAAEVLPFLDATTAQARQTAPRILA